jgi:outer membrane protein TolC
VAVAAAATEPEAAPPTVVEPLAPAPLSANAAAWYGTRPRIDRQVGADEAVALALQYSPVIAAMQQDVEMARQMLAMARARTAPMASANAWATAGDAAMIVNGAPGVEPLVSRLVPSGPSLDLNFMAMYPLFTGGRLGAQINAERSRLQATEQELQTMRLDMALQVLTMVRRLTTMRGMIEVAHQAVLANEERLRIDRATYAAGKVPLANVLRNEAELANSRQQLANQVRDYRLMLADLKAMLGVHPFSAFDIITPAVSLPATPPAELVQPAEGPAPSPAPVVTPATPDTAVLADLDAAARHRPELAGARSRILAAGYDLSAANAAFRPQVSAFGMADLFASRMNAMERWEEYTIGIAVSLPLFDGGMRGAQVRKARAERARLTAQEQDTALRVTREVDQAHERIAAARTNIETSRAALAAAREDYRLMQLRYQAGLAVNVEVLDALRMRTMAEVNYLTAVQELAIAEDQRRRAVGDPALLATTPASDAAAAEPLGRSKEELPAANGERSLSQPTPAG